MLGSPKSEYIFFPPKVPSGILHSFFFLFLNVFLPFLSFIPPFLFIFSLFLLFSLSSLLYSYLSLFFFPLSPFSCCLFYFLLPFFPFSSSNFLYDYVILIPLPMQYFIHKPASLSCYSYPTRYSPDSPMKTCISMLQQEG